jgi:hypothetical protein
MAGDWIPVRTELHEDPAVIGIAHAVRDGRFSVVGRLIRLWAWAGSQTQDGFMPFCTTEDVDRVAERAGIADAMIQVGWLVVRDGGIEFPNWDHWNSESSKKRLSEARKKRKQRSKGTNVPKKRDKNGTDCPVLSCDLSLEKDGGAGKEKRSPAQKAPPSFEPPEFAAFWAAYPRKENRSAALLAWRNACIKADLAAVIMAAVEVQKKSGSLSADTTFIPHPDTWINNQRWLDEVPANKGKDQKNGQPNDLFALFRASKPQDD